MRKQQIQSFLALALTSCLASPAFGASHREAPAIGLLEEMNQSHIRTNLMEAH